MHNYTLVDFIFNQYFVNSIDLSQKTLLISLSLVTHILEISLCKFLELNKLFIVYDFDNKGLVVAFVESGVAFASRTIPVLASIKTSDIEWKIDTLTYS